MSKLYEEVKENGRHILRPTITPERSYISAHYDELLRALKHAESQLSMLQAGGCWAPASTQGAIDAARTAIARATVQS